MGEGTAPRVVGFGELLWDCFEDRRSPGGAPANVAVHAGQLGCRAALVSRVGADAAGDELLALLSERGLELEAVQRDRDLPTGWVSIRRGAGGEPDYRIHEGVAWEQIRLTEEVGRVVGEADAVCYGTLLQRHPSSERALFLALEDAPAPLKVYDVNLRQRWWTPARIRRSLRHADVVKLNEDEARVISRAIGEECEPEELGRRLVDEFELQAVCLTRGSEGCWVCSAVEEYDIPGVPVRVVDPVGAGDSFTAAFVSAWLDGHDLEASATFANRVGGLVAGQAGAMPRLEEPFGELRATLLGA